jgi:hypothetical protein
MANEGYHEPIDELTDKTRDMHRAITSLMEELEAVDWYNQRVDACKDDELKAILAHKFLRTIVTRKRSMQRWFSSGYGVVIRVLTRS